MLLLHLGHNNLQIVVMNCFPTSAQKLRKITVVVYKNPDL
jgi:hypothetical protein